MDSSTLRLDWLRSFQAFAQTCSFTEAARRSHLSQPALFTQIRQLGEAVGRPLYHRIGRQLVLSEVGREVEALAADVLGPIDRFARRLAGAEDPPPVISAGRATHLYLLAGPLRRWGRPISLRAEDRASALDALRSGRADLAVTPMSEEDPGLLVEPVARVRAVAILPEADPLAASEGLPLAALAERPLILPPRGRPHREAVVAALGAPPRVVVEADGWELMALYAALGMGVAIVNETLPPPPGAVAVPVLDLPAQRFCLLRRREAAAPLVAALADHLLGELRAARGPGSAPSSPPPSPSG